MPSLRNLLCIALSASLLHPSSAAPVVVRHLEACIISTFTSTYVLPPQGYPTPSTTATSVSSATTAVGVIGIVSGATIPTVPTNGGSTELPAPTTALKYVTVGRGVQNYSCSAVGAAPVAIGAIATLYDLTSLALKSETTLNTVPPEVVYIPIASTDGIKLTVGDVAYPRIGHHYFLADGTPTFDFTESSGDILFGKKIASVNAPANADIGPDGTGAVPWLTLTNSGGSVGLSEVYRVVTAGGKAPATCADTNLISIQYAAEYWLYK